MIKYFFAIGMLLFVSCNNQPEAISPVASTSTKDIAKSPPPKINSFSSLLFFEHLKGKVRKISSSTFLAKNVNHQLKKVTLGNTYVTSFNEYGHGVEKTYKNSTGKIQTTTVFQDNGSGPCLNAKVFSSTKTLLKVIELKYDSSGRLIDEKSIPAKGKLVSDMKYLYNTQSQRVEDIKYNEVNKIDMKTNYHYNNMGEIDETTFLNPSKRSTIVCKSKYSNYDAQGNWLRCEQQTNKGSFFIIERSIEYYP